MTDTSGSTRPGGRPTTQTMRQDDESTYARQTAYDPAWDKHADVQADHTVTTVTINDVDVTGPLEQLTRRLVGLDDERSVWAELPGAMFARSWLAVSLASSDDEKKSAYYRAMNIEIHEDGVRLTATNGVWSAQAWVPAVGFTNDLGHTEPVDTVEPLHMFTVFDADWRVRAMMKFLAKLAKDPGEDVGPPVRLAVRPAPTTSDQTPVLGEVFEARELHVDIPDLERVTVRVLEQQSWWDWRKAMVPTPVELRDEIRLTSLSDSVLAAFGKLPKIALGIGITVDWDGTDKGFWTVTGSTLDFPPHGIVSTL
jgi:hypothetical protein